jgi:hypothetical protein
VSGAYAYYSQSLDAQVSNQLAMESALRRALQCNEFYLVFQPKYHAQTSQLAGLRRWCAGAIPSVAYNLRLHLFPPQKK